MAEATSNRATPTARGSFIMAVASLLVAWTCLGGLAVGQAPTQNQPPDSTGQTPGGQNPPPAAKGTGTMSAQELANQANNPAAPVTLIQFRDILLPSVPGTNGVTNGLQMQPVLPIGPFKAFPFVQLMKITLPFFLTVPGPVNQTGLGDLQLFDLLTIKQSWGRWGFGPALVFPTATDTALGAGKWQAGPSVALIYTGVTNLTAGAIVQNPISFAGSPNRASVNNMIVSPTFTLNLKEGWFVGLSDYNWTFNWESGGATTLPLGVQVGKIIRLGKQPISLSAEAGGTAVRPANTPNPGWIFGFELTPIFNFHVGPGEKVKVRKVEQ